ncbi:MAG: hypothetical protein IJ223_06180 [Clostridia bacterium]|nr:hypothetical protein [Clostridia bacterium]
MEKEFVSRQQVDLLRQRIFRAEETKASQELDTLLTTLQHQKHSKLLSILVVGAGGSYPAAIFAKCALKFKLNTPYVSAVTPQTAVRILKPVGISFSTNAPHYDLVIGLSYSGKTEDIKAVAKLCKEYKYCFALVTGAEKIELKNDYWGTRAKIISYFNPNDISGKERGMISMFSTLAPVIIFDDDSSDKFFKQYQNSLLKAEEFVNSLPINEIASAIKEHPIIHVFYELDTLASAKDIESKFIEAGIANVVMHEKKNFSHGRYTLLYKQPFALAINLVRPIRPNGFDMLLSRFLENLCKERKAKYLEFRSDLLYATHWNVDILMILPYFITSIGEALGIDISKPFKPGPFPKEAIELFNYSGKF